MVAYADREALERTRATGQAHYRSRSRGELWQKGATSGHSQPGNFPSTACSRSWTRERGSGMPFVHLHTHSEYSLLDGANRIPDLLDRIRALGMDSLALTDHGNLHGAWQFYTEAKARGVRP